MLDKWIYFLKYTKNLTLIPKEFENIKPLEQAFQIAAQHTWNKKELEIYDYIALKKQDEINALQTAEEKGIQKSIEKIAVNLLKKNTPIHLITEVTE